MNKIEIKYYSDSTVYGDFLNKQDWFVYLDSCNDIANFGRYDILSCKPETKITSFRNKIVLNHNGVISSFYDNPIDIIKKFYKINKQKSSLPFNNGMIGYFGYEAFNGTKSAEKSKFPDIAVGFYNWSIVVDHKLKKTYVNFKERNHFINDVIDKFNSDKIEQNNIQNYTFSNFRQHINKQQYVKDVLKIKDYIVNGDCYQVNYSQNFSANYDGDPWDIYKNIRVINPAPYSSFLSIEDNFIISSSPERFLSLKNNIVETKPIKGTLKRLDDKSLDANQINILKRDEKNLAENLMIVDLLRNDLSKCCLLNTVKVEKLFDIESYASVHHMVSTVCGKLDKNYTSVDILKACFPGGSITGAPKTRSMEIIYELEKRKRNIYCGSIGYFDFNNNMDTNICIRTVMLNNGKLNFSAGGGIVHDSKPEDEYYESLEKVSIFINLFSNGKFSW